MTLVSLIVLGILSRVVHTGYALFDKYLGDALYAAMVFTILRIGWKAPWARVGALTMALLVALELVQLTGMPLKLAASGSPVLRLLARLLGTEFSFFDMLAYAVGIAGMRYVGNTDGRRLQPRPS